MISVIEFKQVFKAGESEPIDMVLVAPQGAGNDKVRTWHRVDKIKPPATGRGGAPLSDVEKNGLSYKDMVAKWSVIEPRYNAWRQGNEVPETGTPLGVWGGVTQEQSDRLRSMGIRTVEDVVAMNDATCEKLGWASARKLPAMAKTFLESSDVAAKDAEIASMRERMAAMEAMLAETMNAEEKPKRGRPRKTENDEAA